MEIILKIYGLMATIPFIPFFLIYYTLIYLKKSKKTAFNWSTYVTSLLLLTAVTAELKGIFHVTYGFWINIAWILFIIFSLGFLQWKMKGYLNYVKLITATAKLSFFSFGLLYFVLFIIGIYVN